MTPKEKPKQETLEEAAEKYAIENWGDEIMFENNKKHYMKIFQEGAKWQKERMYSEEDMIKFAEFIATYSDKNKNVNGEMLYAKSKYDGAERTIDLLQIWEQFKKK